MQYLECLSNDTDCYITHIMPEKNQTFLQTT